MKTPLPEPPLEQVPAEPQFVAPPAPTGISKVFNKQKHAEATASAHAAWAEQHKQWADYVHRVLPAKNAQLLEAHATAEQQRADLLAKALAAYRSECAERERSVAETNEELEELKKALAEGDPGAVNEYVAIVLSNSVYPEAFEVDYEFEFDAELRELTIAVIVGPRPRCQKPKPTSTSQHLMTFARYLLVKGISANGITEQWLLWHCAHSMRCSKAIARGASKPYP